jgi:hypothetical protein
MMPFSVTKNSRPLELLLPRDQQKLLEWPYGWVVLTEAGIWQPQETKPNKRGLVYRGVEEVVSVWCNVYQAWEKDRILIRKYGSREMADENAEPHRVGILRIDVKAGKITLHVEDHE